MARAVGLLSGGLDSMLAVALLQRQKVEILAVSFVTPFFGSDRAEEAARRLGVPFRAVDITARHLEVVKHPRFGYGRNMNPCIDCHALMLNVAGKILEAEGYDLLFTGEVLGERPKSQNLPALGIVAKESGYPDLVLRPLSAKLLKATKPEREGLVDRERLLDFRGRSRKRQMALAAEFGITEYPSPAGGCPLTDQGYSRRLRDLLDRDPQAGADDMRLLALGRHLRLAEKTRLVLGRNKEENEKLEGVFRPGDVKVFVRGVMGPTGLLRGPADPELKRLAASICVRYSDAPRDKASPVRFVPIPATTSAAGVEEELSALPAPSEVIDPRII
jgi:tRNA-uridine 2-sulfurtransferase